MADEFVDSVGVNLRLREYPHLFPLIHDRLRELGVRHIAEHHRAPTALLTALGDIGVRVTLYIGAGQDAPAVARAHLPRIEALAFMTFPRNLPDWSDRQREWMTTNHRALKRDPLTRHLTVIGPTVSQPELRTALGDLTEITDAGGVGSPSWTTPPGGVVLDELLRAYRDTLYPGSHPLIVPQALYASGGDDPTSLPEAHQARYLVRSFLENWRRGIARTFGSHLIDGAGDQFERGLGIVRRDGTPKEAFGSLRALLRLLNDPGPPFTPAPLAISIEGDTRELGTLVLQKRDGRYFVVLWLGTPASDPSLSRAVTLTFGSAPGAVRVHRAAANERIEDRPPLARLALSVSEDPVVVELVPSVR